MADIDKILLQFFHAYIHTHGVTFPPFRKTEASEWTSTSVASTFNTYALTAQIPTPKPSVSDEDWVEPPLDRQLWKHGGTSRKMAREFLHVEDFTFGSLWATSSAHWSPNNQNEVACQCCKKKKVACTLHYLADEVRLCKTANAFGLLRQVVLKIVRQVCTAITVHLGPVFIQLSASTK